MKKLLSVLFLFCAFKSFSQPTNYVPRNSKDFIRALYADSALHIPTGCGYPHAATTYQWKGGAMLWGDTCNNKLYFYSDSTWRLIVDSTYISTTVVNSDTLSNYWRLSGNGVSNGKFLGSTNNRSVVFKTNNTTRAVLDSNGRFGIGSGFPTKTFSIGEQLWLYNEDVTQSRIEAASGARLLLRGGSDVTVLPNIYNAGGGQIAFDHSVSSDYVNQSFISGGATTLAKLGILHNQAYFRGVADSMTVALKSQAPASVIIDSSRFGIAYGTSTSAANDLTLPFNGNVIPISGNTQINAITTYAWQAGSIVYLKFSGTPLIKHNTSGGAGTAKIQLAGNVDWTPAAGDIIHLMYDGTDWNEIGRTIEAVAGGSTVPTLQQVFNTEVGGSVLTKKDTINTTSSYNIEISGDIPFATDTATLIVRNLSTNGRAVYGSSFGNFAKGVYGNNTGGGSGVQGNNTSSGAGVVGTGVSGKGLWGQVSNSGGYAGYFENTGGGMAITVPSASGNVGLGTTSSTATRLGVVDNALAGASMVSMTTTSTGAASNAMKILNISSSGANSNNNQTTYGINILDSHTGTGADKWGVYSQISGGSNNTASAGVAGIVVSGAGMGVYGSASGNGYGVLAESLASSGNATALYAIVDASGATNGYAGWFQSTSATNNYAIIVPSNGGRVGIGTSTPNAAAKIEIASTTQGLLLPRMTKTERDAISSPPAGLMIYQTDNTPGLRVYNGTNWMRFTETTD